MKVRTLSMEGLLLIEPRVFTDHRGYFLETWSASRYAERGAGGTFVQDNLSRSTRHTLRGLHLQHPHDQGKLVTVMAGEVFDVAVDIRVGSPTFGLWAGARLSEENHLQMYIPSGFAHGFCVMSDTALFAYKCTEPYHPESEIGLAWNDPQIGIEWPVAEPLLSDRDRSNPTLKELLGDPGRLPRYVGSHGS